MVELWLSLDSVGRLSALQKSESDHSVLYDNTTGSDKFILLGRLPIELIITGNIGSNDELWSPVL